MAYISLLLSLAPACTGKAKVEERGGEVLPAVAESIQEEIHTLPETILPDGQVLKLELAITNQEITQGLMFRPHLAENRGMFFLFSRERIPSFWMKNTLIPLDIIFLDPAGRVVDIAANAHPCTGEPCPQYVPQGPALAVLEINGGAAAAHKIEIGSVIRFQRVPDYPKTPTDNPTQG